jgi:hypothetical protein
MHAIQINQQTLAHTIVQVVLLPVSLFPAGDVFLQVLGETLSSCILDDDSAWLDSGDLVLSILQRLQPDMSSSGLLLRGLLHRFAVAKTPALSLSVLLAFATLANQDGNTFLHCCCVFVWFLLRR